MPTALSAPQTATRHVVKRRGCVLRERGPCPARQAPWRSPRLREAIRPRNVHRRAQKPRRRQPRSRARLASAKIQTDPLSVVDVGSRALSTVSAPVLGVSRPRHRETVHALARISHQGHGLRGAVRLTGQERRAARCGASGKRLDAPCQPDSAALRVAPRRPPASSRASTVGPATPFGPLLADRTPGRDAGRDPGEKCGLRHHDVEGGLERSDLDLGCGQERHAELVLQPRIDPAEEDITRVLRMMFDVELRNEALASRP